MALVYRIVKDTKLAVFASTFTPITQQPEVVQTSPLYHPKACRKSFLLIMILPLWLSFTLSALPVKTTSIGHETGLQHYNMNCCACLYHICSPRNLAAGC